MKKIIGLLSVSALSVLFTGCVPANGAAQDPASMGAGGIFAYLGIMVVFFGIMYFIAIRPQKKQEKEQQEMLATMRVGDTVLTTSGFYGVVIDITNDTIIVEFGNNKNCRIPMQRAAVVQLEHAEDALSLPAEESAPKEEKKAQKEDKKEAVK